MRRFLFEIFVFFIIWFIVSLIIDIGYTNHLKKENIREVVIWEDIINSKVNADIVYLGSSRAADHYQPDVIDNILGTSSYNLGQYGQSIESDIIRYNMLKKYETDLPKLFIWDVYYASFNISSKYQDEQYTPFLFNKDIWDDVNRYSVHFNLFDKYIPLLRYWKKNVIPYYEALRNPKKGFVYNIDKWNPDEIIKIQKHSIDYYVDSNMFNEFTNTICNMKLNKCNVIVVFSPMHKKGQSAIKNLGLFVEQLQETTKQEHVIFLNFLDDSLCYDSTYFKNTMHLNEIGTDVFSEKIAHIIDSLSLLDNNTLSF